MTARRLHGQSGQPCPSLILGVRQFDRHVRRGAYHSRATVRVGPAPQCLDHQEELLGEHGNQPPRYSHSGLSAGFATTMQTIARLMFPAVFTPPPKWFLRAFIRFRRSVATKPDHAAVRACVRWGCSGASGGTAYCALSEQLKARHRRFLSSAATPLTERLATQIPTSLHGRRMPNCSFPAEIC